MTDTQLLQQIADSCSRMEARQATTTAALLRIEGKQDFLIAALAEGDDGHVANAPLEPSDPK